MYLVDAPKCANIIRYLVIALIHGQYLTCMPALPN